jgi:hypothetical protein
MTKCRKCAKCCVIFNYIKQIWIPCPYLDLKTNLCTIYKKRLGTYLGYGFTCGLRKHLPYNIPDCPYNKKRRRIHPKYRS